MPTDPVVSPADTIRLLLSDLSEGYAEPDVPDRAEEASELLDALLAVGERDRAEIERLQAALTDWQQTAEASETECAAWRGFADSANVLCNAIDKDRSITQDRTVYTQERWAADLKERARQIRAEYGPAAHSESQGERDRRKIARLTEALERIAKLGHTSTSAGGERRCPRCIARAVLADEEDTRP